MAVYGPAIWIIRATPDTWVFYMAFLNDTTLYVPASGWYRIYCIGKSGNGEARGGTRYDSSGSAGGGSGGMAISNLLLSKGLEIEIAFSGGIAKFGEYLYATPGTNGSYAGGGSGGNGANGNVANLSGFTGGLGGSSGMRGGTGYQGGNNGMSGGPGGFSMSETQWAGGGGGGGARLPGDGICPYIYSPSLSGFRAAGGGNQNTASTIHASSYPSPTLTADMKLYGGGGGGGGHGYFTEGIGGYHSEGTPAVVIIERAG